jgi:hypothetical protein
MLSLDRTSEISALILTFTTCVVLLYATLLLTTMIANRKIWFHKRFWILVGVSYMSAFLTMIWPLILILVGILLTIFIVKKVKPS